MRTIGLQMYTVRTLVKKDLDVTLFELNAIGIKQIEVSRMPINEDTAIKINQHQLSVCSIQITMKKLLRDTDQVIRFAKSVHASHVVVSVLPWWGHIPWVGIKRLIKKMHEVLSIYEKEGIHVSFHHHAYEIKHDLLTVLDQKLDQNIGFIMDTYWITKSGKDPLKVYQAFKHRIKGIHLRDYFEGYDISPGKGTIHFKDILDILPDSVYTVIEVNAVDPLISIEEAKHYLEGLL